VLKQFIVKTNKIFLTVEVKAD